MQATIETVRRVPEQFPCAEGEVRRALVRRFPCAVLYLVDPESVAVVELLAEAGGARLVPGLRLGELLLGLGPEDDLAGQRARARAST